MRPILYTAGFFTIVILFATIKYEYKVREQQKEISALKATVFDLENAPPDTILGETIWLESKPSKRKPLKLRTSDLQTREIDSLKFVIDSLIIVGTILVLPEDIEDDTTRVIYEDSLCKVDIQYAYISREFGVTVNHYVKTYIKEVLVKTKQPISIGLFMFYTDYAYWGPSLTISNERFYIQCGTAVNHPAGFIGIGIKFESKKSLEMKGN